MDFDEEVGCPDQRSVGNFTENTLLRTFVGYSHSLRPIEDTALMDISPGMGVSLRIRQALLVLTRSQKLTKIQ